MSKVTPCLWFNGRVQEALDLYASVFDDFEILQLSTYPEGSPGLVGEVMMATFRLADQELMILNGGPHYTLSPAISLLVNCQSQDEVDHYWDALVEGGEPNRCGWLTDRFGLSWQIVPRQLGELMSGPDPQRCQRVMEAMLAMVKLDVAGLQAAFDG